MKIRDFIREKSVLNRLILANVMLFLCVWAVELMLTLYGFLLNEPIDAWFRKLIYTVSMPATWQQFLQQPWAIITSLLLQTEFWHLLFNMIMLFVAGKIFCYYFSEKKMLYLYFLGGISGNIFFVMAFNIFPTFAAMKHFSVALGASGCVMAILSAITVHKPNHSLHLILLGPVALKWVMLTFVIIDLLSIPKSNAGGHIAHLGGALFGAAYTLYIGKRSDFSIIHRRKNRKKIISFDARQQARHMSDAEYNAKKVQQQKKVDDILDKISKSGYDALSKEEKNFLFFYSKK